MMSKKLKPFLFHVGFTVVASSAKEATEKLLTFADGTGMRSKMTYYKGPAAVADPLPADTEGERVIR